MQIAKSVFQNVESSGANILVVTKYWDTETTQGIIQQAQAEYSDIVYGFGENRLESLKQKKLPREIMHFIGNIQSRKIPEIIQYCSTIHSLASIKHAQKIESLGVSIHAFIQIRQDPDKPIGILPEELPAFLDVCRDYSSLHIIGISGMGVAQAPRDVKRQEFDNLINLRNEYMPDGLISAGTSRDYEVALECGIDIVRVGQKAVIM